MALPHRQAILYALSLEPTKAWIEPEVPGKISEKLWQSSPKPRPYGGYYPSRLLGLICWIRAVKTPETRQKHIEVALDKLNKAHVTPLLF